MVAEQADASLAPIAGIRERCLLSTSQLEYLQRVDTNGRQVREGKLARIRGAVPAVLHDFGANGQRGHPQVLTVRSGYRRAKGAPERLVKRACALGQRWMRGIGMACGLAMAR